MSAAHTRRRFGRAADPVPDEPAETTAENNSGEPLTEPLADDAAPEEIAALAALAQQDAETARTAAAGRTAEATSALADAQARADAILAGARQTAGALQAEATALTREAEAAEGTQRSVTVAAAVRHKAAEADAHLAALEDEREQLLERIPELTSLIAARQAERDDCAGKLAEADAAFDPVSTGLAQELARLERGLAAQRDQLQQAGARRSRIGDGTGPGELTEARAAAAAHHARLRAIFNALWPGREEALDDALAAELQAVTEGAREWAAGVERQRQEDARRRPQVHIG